MRRRARIGIVFLSVLFLLIALPGVASAHSGEESYVYLDIYDTSIEGRVELPIIDVNEILALNIPQGEEAEEAVAANLALLQNYAAEHFAIGTDTRW